MPEVKHYPGPWVIRQNNTYDSHFEILIEGRYDGHEQICLCRQKHARLIAAAPALLEALEGVVKADQHIHPTDGIFATCEALYQAHEAIKLAKGE